MSKKAILFLSILIIGLVTFILTIFVYRLDGTLGLSLTIAGTLCFLGGAIGSCVYIKPVRELFAALIEAVF